MLLCTALAMTAVSASAMVIETSQFAFDADPATLTATLTEPMTNLRGHIIVPETVTGSDGAVYTVTAIAPEALSNLGHIEILDLPAGIQTLGSKAFANCLNLTETNIPDGVRTVPVDLYQGCSSLTKLTVGSGLTEMPDGFLSGKTNLNTLIFSDSDEPIKICDLALRPSSQFNTSITTVYMGRNLESTSIAKSLQNLTIGPKVTRISRIGESSITELKLGENVKEIAENAFSASPIEKLEINSCLDVVYMDAFNPVKEVYVDKIEDWLRISLYGTPLVTNSSYLFTPRLIVGGELLTELVVPENITEIKHGAFKDYALLEKVALHDGVESVGNYAFENCGLSELPLNKTLRRIGVRAFCGNNFKITELPDELDEIGEEAFARLECDPTLRVNATVIGKRAFYRVKPSTLILGPRVMSVGEEAFLNDTYVTPNNKSTITELVIEGSDSTISFGNAVFAEHMDYFDVEKVSLGRNYSGEPFYNCRFLTDLTIGEALTEIPTGGFYLSTSLTTLRIGPSIKKIGDSFFRAPLKNIIFEDGPEPLEISYIGAIPNTDTPTEINTLYIGRNIKQYHNPSYVPYWTEPMTTVGAAYTAIGRYVKSTNAAISGSLIRCFAYNPPRLNGKILKTNQRVEILEGRWNAFRKDEQWKEFADIDDTLPFIKPETLEIDKTEFSGRRTDKFDLHYTIGPETDDENSEINLVPTVTWSSTDDEVASVDENGTVTLNSMGECDIVLTAAANPDLIRRCHVVVGQTFVEAFELYAIDDEAHYGVKFSTEGTELYIGQSVSLYSHSVTVIPELAEDRRYEISVADPEIISMEKDGNTGNTCLRVNKRGTTSLSIKALDGSGAVTTFPITVTVPVKEIRFNICNPCKVRPNERVRIEAVAYPEDATYPQVYLKGLPEPDEDGLYTITESCVVEASTIYYQDETHPKGNPYRVLLPLNVIKDLEYVSKFYILPHYNALTDYTCYGMPGVVTDLEISTIPAYVRWEVEPVSGSAEYNRIRSGGYHLQLKSQELGQSVVRVHSGDYGGLSLTVTYNVLDHKYVPVGGVSVSRTNDWTNRYASVGDVIQYEASVSPSNADNQDVEWSSSDPEVATVDANGVVTCLSEGTTYICATSKDDSVIEAARPWGEQILHVEVSAVESVRADGLRTYDVYTVDGILLRTDADKEYVNTLESGIYILRFSDGSVSKVKIK